MPAQFQSVTSLPLASVLDIRPSLEDLGLGWLAPLEDAPLYHTRLIDAILGPDFRAELTTRMAETTVFPGWLCAVLIDDYVGYCRARAWLPDLDEPLVACLLPDQAQHVFLLYDAERIKFHETITNGHLIRHDPAGESALVNTPADIAKTRSLMDRCGIQYHDLLWQDHIRFPRGAVCLPGGIMART